jgi:Domain of unknown function (DUF5666)
MHRSTRRLPAAAIGTIAAVMAVGATAAGVAGAATTTPHGRFGPGASGSVAAITGSSMEVQSQETGQVTVSWTSSTTFTQNATITASSVAVGDCVTVTGTTAKSTTITAKSVAITPAPSSGGTCGAGFTGGAPGRFAGRGTGSSGGGSGGGSGSRSFPGGQGGPPSGASGSRSHRGFPGGGSFSFASGKVTAATGSSLTISGFSSATFRQQAGKNPPKKGATKKSTTARKAPKATTVKVAVNGSTTYTETQSAAASDLAVGDCVRANGTSNSNGSVTATTVDITSTGGQTCTTGFGFAGGGPGATTGG